MSTRWFLSAAVLAGAVVGSASADDIWARRDPRYANLFQDNRARNVGDILTVLISEATSTNDQEQRQQNKANSFNGSAAVFGTPTVAATTGSFDRKFAGTAQLTSNRQFTDRLAVTVVDVMPNGNLVVEGYRSRVVAGEERVLKLTGTVRAQDVAVGNIVQSTSLANAKLSYLGRGPESRSVNQNLLGRVFNRVWPF